MCGRYDDPSQIEETWTFTCQRCLNQVSENNCRLAMYMGYVAELCPTCEIAMATINSKLDAIIASAN